MPLKLDDSLTKAAIVWNFSACRKTLFNLAQSFLSISLSTSISDDASDFVMAMVSSFGVDLCQHMCNLTRVFRIKVMDNTVRVAFDLFLWS